jgi:hypothetical protein
MARNTWIVEVALSRDVRTNALRWEPAGTSAETSTFPNDQRKLADSLATKLQRGIGRRAIVRCRGTAPNRGAFYPDPIAATEGL